MSNADKIRAMGDEELADLIFCHGECPPHREWCDCTFVGSCKECRLEWLRAEAQPGGTEHEAV